MIYIASYESRNFSFDAVGLTDAGARESLIAGLRAHAKKYSLEADWFRLDGIECREMAIGITYCDHQPLDV